MVDSNIVAELTRLGIEDILLWLLSFAVVNGLLGVVEIPKMKSVRVIISMVISFFVLMAAPASLISTLSSMSTSLLVVLLGLFILLVFIEVGGVKHFEPTALKKDDKGNVTHVGVTEVPFFSKNTTILALAVLLIALLIFIGAGGPALLGISIPSLANINLLGVGIIIVIILGVLWIIGDKD